jgi:hypothetical protein
LDGADTAGALESKTRMITKARNGNSISICDLEDGFAGLGGEVTAVDTDGELGGEAEAEATGTNCRKHRMKKCEEEIEKVELVAVRWKVERISVHFL